jgi:hypothetical protein
METPIRFITGPFQGHFFDEYSLLFEHLMAIIRMQEPMFEDEEPSLQMVEKFVIPATDMKEACKFINTGLYGVIVRPGETWHIGTRPGAVQGQVQLQFLWTDNDNLKKICLDVNVQRLDNVPVGFKMQFYRVEVFAFLAREKGLQDVYAWAEFEGGRYR